VIHSQDTNWSIPGSKFWEVDHIDDIDASVDMQIVVTEKFN